MVSLFFILMSVRLIFLKGGEFKGTCASQGNVCEDCGKKGDEIVCNKCWIFIYRPVRSPFGRLEPQPLFFYIFVMKKQKNDLEVRIENLIRMGN